MNDYENAKACYRRFGVDVERALARLAEKAISIHCWQGDDVAGFDQKDGKAGDGIQTTGNYPGKARNFEELKADFLKAAGLIPGKNASTCMRAMPCSRKGSGWTATGWNTNTLFRGWILRKKTAWRSILTRPAFRTPW